MFLLRWIRWIRLISFLAPIVLKGFVKKDFNFLPIKLEFSFRWVKSILIPMLNLNTNYWWLKFVLRRVIHAMRRIFKIQVQYALMGFNQFTMLIKTKRKVYTVIDFGCIRKIKYYLYTLSNSDLISSMKNNSK